MSSPRYTIIVLDSSSNQNLLTTIKSRYASEPELISSLAQKLLHPQVTSIDFSKANENEVHVRILIRGGDADAARNLVYGSDFARER
jgi:hypothetical protein